MYWAKCGENQQWVVAGGWFHRSWLARVDITGHASGPERLSSENISIHFLWTSQPKQDDSFCGQNLSNLVKTACWKSWIIIFMSMIFEKPVEVCHADVLQPLFWNCWTSTTSGTQRNPTDNCWKHLIKSKYYYCFRFMHVTSSTMTRVTNQTDCRRKKGWKILQTWLQMPNCIFSWL